MRGPGVHAEREKVAAPDERARRLVFDAERARALEKPADPAAVEVRRLARGSPIRATRASSSRSTFCASRRNAPSPTGVADLKNASGLR